LLNAKDLSPRGLLLNDLYRTTAPLEDADAMLHVTLREHMKRTDRVCYSWAMAIRICGSTWAGAAVADHGNDRSAAWRGFHGIQAGGREAFRGP
jgi:hypothetical protein